MVKEKKNNKQINNENKANINKKENLKKVIK